jgi:hypothetical protein
VVKAKPHAWSKTLAKSYVPCPFEAEWLILDTEFQKRVAVIDPQNWSVEDANKNIQVLIDLRRDLAKLSAWVEQVMAVERYKWKEEELKSLEQANKSLSDDNDSGQFSPASSQPAPAPTVDKDTPTT